MFVILMHDDETEYVYMVYGPFDLESDAKIYIKQEQLWGAEIKPLEHPARRQDEQQTQ